MVIGHLRAHGYGVTHERMRQAIHATDPINRGKQKVFFAGSEHPSP